MKRSLALLLTSTGLAIGAGALPSPALLVPAVGLAVVTVLAWTSVMVGARRLRVSRRLLTREVRHVRAVAGATSRSPTATRSSESPAAVCSRSSAGTGRRTGAARRSKLR